MLRKGKKKVGREFDLAKRVTKLPGSQTEGGYSP